MYVVSSCTAERSPGVPSMKLLKTSLCSSMAGEQLSSFAILHIHNHKDINFDVIVKFAEKKKGA